MNTTNIYTGSSSPGCVGKSRCLRVAYHHAADMLSAAPCRALTLRIAHRASHASHASHASSNQSKLMPLPLGPQRADYPMTDSVIQTASDTWCDDPVTGAIVYGDISTWDTSDATDMSSLFSGKVSCNPNIASWDTSSGVWLDRKVRKLLCSTNPTIYGWSHLTTRKHANTN